MVFCGMLHSLNKIEEDNFDPFNTVPNEQEFPTFQAYGSFKDKIILSNNSITATPNSYSPTNDTFVKSLESFILSDYNSIGIEFTIAWYGGRENIYIGFAQGFTNKINFTNKVLFHYWITPQTAPSTRDNYAITNNPAWIAGAPADGHDTGNTMRFKYTQTGSDPTTGKIEIFNVTQSKQWYVIATSGTNAFSTTLATNIVFYSDSGGGVSDIKFVDVDKI